MPIVNQGTVCTDFKVERWHILIDLITQGHLREGYNSNPIIRTSHLITRYVLYHPVDVLEALQTLNASVQHHHCVESSFLHRPFKCGPHCHVPVEGAGEFTGSGAGAEAITGACKEDIYPESTYDMSGLRESPEQGQVVLRPGGGASLILEGTRPWEMKAAGQSVTHFLFCRVKPSQQRPSLLPFWTDKIYHRMNKSRKHTTH